MADNTEQFYIQLKREAEAGGYFLNPDAEFTKQLLAGMLKNKERYGYPSCPCRLASGERQTLFYPLALITGCLSGRV